MRPEREFQQGRGSAPPDEAGASTEIFVALPVENHGLSRTRPALLADEALMGGMPPDGADFEDADAKTPAAVAAANGMAQSKEITQINELKMRWA